jgi:hypothetical protein
MKNSKIVITATVIIIAPSDQVWVLLLVFLLISNKPQLHQSEQKIKQFWGCF